MTETKMPIAIISSFLWIGFVCAISFMEAWLKFRAPGVTLPIGLGIGRLVFNVLNKIEWVFALVIILNIVFSTTRKISIPNSLVIISIVLLLLQTFWLLPILDSRAEMHIQNKIVPPSNLHFYYVAMEVVKVVCLTIFGISLFKLEKI